MAKVRTLARNFLKGHIIEGKPTYFVEQVLNALDVKYLDETYLYKLYDLNQKKIAEGKLTFEDIESFYISLVSLWYDGQKLHTIRAGKHFKKFVKS